MIGALDSTAECLEVLADQLDRAPRQGAERDEPEGARYIVVSDTAIQEIAAHLRIAARDIRAGASR